MAVQLNVLLTLALDRIISHRIRGNPRGGLASLRRCGGLMAVGGTPGLLLEGVIHILKVSKFRVVCIEQVQCTDIFRVGCSHLSLGTKNLRVRIYRFAFLAAITSSSVDSNQRVSRFSHSPHTHTHTRAGAREGNSGVS